MLHWFHSNKLSINASKTHYSVITKKRTLPVLELILDGLILQRETFVKFLGVYVDDKLTRHEHIRHCKSKLTSSLFAINMAKRCLTPQLLLTLYNSLVYPYLIHMVYYYGDLWLKSIPTRYSHCKSGQYE